MLTANEIVKEQIIQTTSKKIVRLSEKKPRACVPHTPYVRTEGFVRATACYPMVWFCLDSTNLLGLL